MNDMEIPVFIVAFLLQCVLCIYIYIYLLQISIFKSDL